MITKPIIQSSVILFLTIFLLACSRENGTLDDFDSDLYSLDTKVEDVFARSVGAPELTTQQKNDVIVKSYRFLASLNTNAKQANPAAVSKNIRHYTIMPITLKISDNESVSLSVAHLSANNNDDGYMIFVNDDRIPYPLAYSDTGNWDLSQNKELKEFILTRFQAHITEEIKNAEAANEKPRTKGGADECPWTITLSTSGIFASAYCLSGVTWAQDLAPYKLYTPNGYLAGCTAVALAHIMAYHQYPTVGVEVNRRYGATGPFTTPYSYNWSWMKSEAKASTFDHNVQNELFTMQMIGNLMAEIGWHAPLNYVNPKLTTGSTASAANALSTMGYTSTYYNCYNFTAITNSLDANKPIYIGGTSGSGQMGHDWTIEGYESHYLYNYYEQLQENCPYVISQQFGYDEWFYWDYVWCNWGSEGESNGFYLSGVFTPLIDGTSFNFNYDITMLVDITPN